MVSTKTTIVLLFLCLLVFGTFSYHHVRHLLSIPYYEEAPSHGMKKNSTHTTRTATTTRTHKKKWFGQQQGASGTTTHHHSLQDRNRLEQLVVAEQHQPRARKYDNFQNDHTPRILPYVPPPHSTRTRNSTRNKSTLNTNRNIFFVHIGRSGGTSIKYVLRICCQFFMDLQKRQNCIDGLTMTIDKNTTMTTTTTTMERNTSTTLHDYDNNNNNNNDDDNEFNNEHDVTIVPTYESRLSRKTIGYVHRYKFYPLKAIRRATTVLFPLRHPLDRTVSWFRFVSPYYNCVLLTQKNLCTPNKQTLLDKIRHADAHQNKQQQQGKPLSAPAPPPPAGDHSQSDTTITGNYDYDLQHHWELLFFHCFRVVDDVVQALLLYDQHHHPDAHTRKQDYQHNTMFQVPHHPPTICAQLAWDTLRGEKKRFHDGIHLRPDTPPPSTTTEQQKKKENNFALYTHNDTLIPASLVPLVANIQFYYERTLLKYVKKKEIMVVRTEHLWDDITHIDKHLLGGSGDFGIHHGLHYTSRGKLDGFYGLDRNPFTSTNDHYFQNNHDATLLFFPTDTPPSPEKKNTNANTDTNNADTNNDNDHDSRGNRVLCCALKNEFIVYRNLIQHAINFSDQVKTGTMVAAMTRCGYQSWEHFQQQCLM